MASLLSRFTTFVPNTTILSNDHNQELNRIVNLLNGTTTNLKTVLKTSDAGDPPLELDQLSTGPIQKWFQGGVLKATLTNSGGLTMSGELTLSSAAPVIRMTDSADVDSVRFDMVGAQLWRFVNEDLSTVPLSFSLTTDVFTFGQIPALPASDPTTDNQAARRKFVTDRTVGWTATVYTVDPSTAPTGEDYPSVLVPAVATTFKITHIRVEYRAGSHTAGGSVTFKVAQRGSVNQDIGTISLNDTNNAAFTLYTNDVADVTLAAGDRLVFSISARSGTVSERNVSLFVEGVRNVT